jgi:putative transposase
VLTRKLKGKTKRNIKNRQFLLRTKIKNSIIDLHWKTAHFLCKNFETIIIPKFECKNMSSKKNRINSKITRKMLALSHGMFLEKLKFKCNEYKRNLILTNESYTSKTCTNCGNIKNDLNGNKKYNCSKCNISIDRDMNGARNILIKAFSRY